jgi:hypothetical protein
MKDIIVENETLYDFLLENMYFNIARDEKVIFELWRKGENNCIIGKKLNISEGTVRNRKKTLYKRALDTIETFGDDSIKHMFVSEKIPIPSTRYFCVYSLLFPNGKVYIGQSMNPTSRWGKNGNGYKDNKIMYEDIQMYGWKNIKKQVVYKNLTYEESLEKEKELIIHYRTNIPEYGYNTNF